MSAKPSAKYALITGASRGIGRACALRFAREGWHVFLNCRSSLDELSEVQREINSHFPGHCTLVPGDVGSPADVRQIFEKIYQICPCLDVLVNNAGIAHMGLLTDMTDSEWQRLLDTNLSSVFYCCRSAIPPMVTRKQGKDHQHLLYVGNRGGILRGCLLSRQVRHPRTDQGAGQGAGSE